jgi:hypothetical protein
MGTDNFNKICLRLVLLIGTLAVTVFVLYPLLDRHFLAGLFASTGWVYAFCGASQELLRLQAVDTASRTPVPDAFSHDHTAAE